MSGLSSISLFSGIGGLDEGLHQAGFAPLVCVELDKHARESLVNWTNVRGVKPALFPDVKEIDAEMLRKELGLKRGTLDLLAGGPPCQAFSLIGKRRSLDDERGLLLFEMVRYAKAFMPKAILIEQVKGLKSAPGRHGERGGVLAELVRELEAIGYIIRFQVLKASDYGVPQHRERLFLVGLRDSTFQFPQPTHADLGAIIASPLFPSDRLMRFRSVRDAISDLPPPVTKGSALEVSFPNHIDATPARDRERIRHVPEGEFLARQLHLSADLRQRLNPKKDTTKFRRLSWDIPSLTLRCGEVFYHPVEDRYLTPRECLRLHGYPDDMFLSGPIRGRTGTVKNLDQHRQVANSVPPPLAAMLGCAIRKILVDPKRAAVLVSSASVTMAKAG